MRINRKKLSYLTSQEKLDNHMSDSLQKYEDENGITGNIIVCKWGKPLLITEEETRKHIYFLTQPGIGTVSSEERTLIVKSLQENPDYSNQIEYRYLKQLQFYLRSLILNPLTKVEEQEINVDQTSKYTLRFNKIVSFRNFENNITLEFFQPIMNLLSRFYNIFLSEPDFHLVQIVDSISDDLKRSDIDGFINEIQLNWEESFSQYQDRKTVDDFFIALREELLKFDEFDNQQY